MDQFFDIPLFDWSGPSLRPDLALSGAPRGGAVKDGRKATAERREASLTAASTALNSEPGGR
jgi:hypothetical protein